MQYISAIFEFLFWMLSTKDFWNLLKVDIISILETWILDKFTQLIGPCLVTNNKLFVVHIARLNYVNS